MPTWVPLPGLLLLLLQLLLQLLARRGTAAPAAPTAVPAAAAGGPQAAAAGAGAASMGEPLMLSSLEPRRVLGEGSADAHALGQACRQEEGRQASSQAASCGREAGWKEGAMQAQAGSCG